jgi:uncharacterized protein YhjY with autotransporter beta-barrel domain
MRATDCVEAAFPARACGITRVIRITGLLGTLLWFGVAHADLDDPTLYTLDPNSPFTALEIAAAQANQAVYNTLSAKCAVSCSAADQLVLLDVTKLVDTANALLGKGPTGLSLGLDITGLRVALRWTAATEVAAIGSINTKFASNQLAGLASRLSALRWGAGGVANLMAAPGGADAALMAAAMPEGGGGASGSAGGNGTPLSVYYNEAYDYGTKSPTDMEDAFSFDGRQHTLGADYRFSRQFIAGAMLGYSTNTVDFNSDLSVVDGGIRASGYSGLLYGMFESQNYYVSLSGGYQRLTYDITRRITYASFNPAVSGVNTTALSNTASNSLVGSLNVGYNLHRGSWALEPFAIAAYKDIRVDPFQEGAYQTTNPNIPTGNGVAISPQTIRSFVLSAGLKVQYIWSTRLGVIVPYLDGQYNNELGDKSRLYTATYIVSNADVGPLPAFVFATDPAPSHYFTVAGGFSVVLPHGIQGFVQYGRLLDYTNYADTIISGGVRIEF